MPNASITAGAYKAKISPIVHGAAMPKSLSMPPIIDKLVIPGPSPSSLMSCQAKRHYVLVLTGPTAAEVTFVCGVLLDIGGISLFRRVGVMLMLRQLLVF
jgi:hypothetical protein